MVVPVLDYFTSLVNNSVYECNIAPAQLVVKRLHVAREQLNIFLVAVGLFDFDFLPNPFLPGQRIHISSLFFTARFAYPGAVSAAVAALVRCVFSKFLISPLIEFVVTFVDPPPGMNTSCSYLPVAATRRVRTGNAENLYLCLLLVSFFLTPLLTLAQNALFFFFRSLFLLEEGATFNIGHRSF